MTDRYLFRGFHPRENGAESVWIDGKEIKGEWVYGHYVKAIHHWTEKGVHEDWIVVNASQNGGWFVVNQRFPVIRETVGEYTGLIDLNGTKIFEGDIVNVKVRSGSFKKMLIEWDECNVAWLMAKKGESKYHMHKCWEFEVLGSIHSNTDILGSEAEL